MRFSNENETAFEVGENELAINIKEVKNERHCWCV